MLTDDRNYLPFHMYHSGQLVARLACFDDGLDPQEEGYLHDIGQAAADCYDGEVQIIDIRLSEDDRIVATFGQEDPNHVG